MVQVLAITLDFTINTRSAIWAQPAQFSQSFGIGEITAHIRSFLDEIRTVYLVYALFHAAIQGFIQDTLQNFTIFCGEIAQHVVQFVDRGITSNLPLCELVQQRKHIFQCLGGVRRGEIGRNLAYIEVTTRIQRVEHSLFKIFVCLIGFQ